MSSENDTDILLSLLGNGTEDHNDTSEDLYDVYFRVYEYINILDILVSITTLSYGFVSWTLLLKWRTFKNYVLLNVAIAAFLKHLLEHIINNYVYDNYYVYFYFYIIFVFAYSFWMLIMSAMFYSSIVKIFQPPRNGRFLKSALVAWGIPVCLGVIYCVMTKYDWNCGILHVFKFLIFTLLPNLIQLTVFFMYMTVLWNLMKSSGVRRSNQNLCVKVQLATLLLLMSGVTSIACQIVDAFKSDRTVFTLLIENVDLISNIIVCVWMLGTKSNRDLWSDCYRNRSRKRSVNTTMVDF